MTTTRDLAIEKNGFVATIEIRRPPLNFFDILLIRQIADDVLVMRAGRVVEQAPTEELFTRPGHQYTRQLLEAIPHAPARPEIG